MNRDKQDTAESLSCESSVAFRSAIANTVFNDGTLDVKISEEFKGELESIFGDDPVGSISIYVHIDPVLEFAKLGIELEDHGTRCWTIGKVIHCKHPNNVLDVIYTQSTCDRFSCDSEAKSSLTKVHKAQALLVHEITHTRQDDHDRNKDFCKFDAGVDDPFDYQLSAISDLADASPETSAAIVKDHYRCMKGLSTGNNNLEEASCGEISILVQNSTGF